MVNMSAWLDRKYSNLEAATAAQQTEADAHAQLLGAQAASVPAITGATVEREKAQSELAEAQAKGTPEALAAEAAQRRGAGALSQAQAGNIGYLQQPGSDEFTRSLFERLGAGTNPFGTGAPTFRPLASPLVTAPTAAPTTPGAPTIGQPLAPAPAAPAQPAQQSYASGTERVPGKGSGKKDTQKAMLAPGEAVLNKAAAEHLGRHTIALLNALGEQKMGLDRDVSEAPGATDQGTTQGYAKGTAKVPAKKGAPAGGKAGKGKGDDAAAISPKLLAALLQMGGAGAGGMPAPGSAAPMPMPMPQSGGPA